ncbi:MULTISPECIES: LysR substrate-binding domain-containing protein [Rhodobacterales]|uniref:LysR substrate-binding domain-containing protein n=1 Tax=Rhodobacterales TaxID=204455 RepID=UPI00237FA403|nr:LysR substrate-binding domain-containing protein [Phaeobacter gallaeciensis]MDE4190033.1 LysR substrate-binding domain-containing protein [Phaeobacter gallaeciensis]MDE4199186.1 LysR substrate-binding domain-containing protein [Phaeobacter gallaeciensis]MDE4203334.1 LysR substrate-binding domain-containing protein [Phaeobacter gallaeciensis]MDE4207476.1 LysR substrate-binding domain-containing protein [Phaeobacter gallaeciensis]MDE4215300.1 LysR substrate-binding domain-containing protein [
MNFTLRQLTYFQALCANRNFGRAAEACHVSQPALSVQIRALEDVMGGPLVERRARDVVLTPLGRQVLAQADAVLQAAETLARTARDQSSGRRSLVLGVIPTVAPYLLPGTLAQLRAVDLQLAIQVREATTERLLALLQAGELDAAVLALPSGGNGLVEVELFRDRFLLAGSCNRLEQINAHGPGIRPQDLRSEQLMLLEDGHCLTDQALDICGMQRTAPEINMGAGSLATLSRLVAAGFGLTLMPEIAAQAECGGAEGLRVQRFPEPQPYRRIGLVRRDSTDGEGWFEQLAEVVRSVGEGIVSQCRQDSGHAPGAPAEDQEA